MRRLALLAVSLLVGVSSVDAQVGRGGDPRSQLQLEAATLESRGDLDGAERALRRLLELEPDVSGTVFALERVLRAKNDVGALRQVVDEFVARNPSPEVRALQLQLLVEADSVQAMEATAERWLSADRSEDAYRAVAGVYGRAFGPARKLDVLRRGRSALGRRDALALDIADALVESGNLDGAVDEWVLAVADGVATDTVVARIERLGGRARDAGRRFVDELADAPGQRDLALTVALDLGLEAEALELARDQADDLEGRSRVSYLESVAARARAAQVARVATWAYGELGGDAANPEQRREAERRIVATALEAGDTATALAAQRRVAASYAQGSVEGRRALAEAIRLQASTEPSRVVASWEVFRESYPDAPELDEVAAAVAVSLQARGEDEAAVRVLEGIEGPRSTLERAYLLFARGRIEDGRQALLAAVSGLPPIEATPVIQLGSTIGRLSESGKQALVAASVEAHRGRGVAASAELAELASGLPESDRAAVLAEAARIAEQSGSSEGAAAIRERLLADHPDAPEVAEASLALARYVASVRGDGAAAILLLEELIIRQPNAAVVPEARLELERLRSSVGRRGP